MAAPQAFAALFTADAELMEFTAGALRVYMAAAILFGIQIACQMTFIALGKAKESSLVAIMRKFILLLPLIYIMPHIWKSNQTMAVYLAEPVEMCIRDRDRDIVREFDSKKQKKSLEALQTLHFFD